MFNVFVLFGIIVVVIGIGLMVGWVGRGLCERNCCLVEVENVE